MSVGKVDWNDCIPEEEYFSQLERISKERIIWGVLIISTVLKMEGYWKIISPESNLSECEIALYSRLKRVSFVDITWQNINRGEQMIHLCQTGATL